MKCNTTLSATRVLQHSTHAPLRSLCRMERHSANVHCNAHKDAFISYHSPLCLIRRTKSTEQHDDFASLLNDSLRNLTRQKESMNEMSCTHYNYQLPTLSNSDYSNENTYNGNSNNISDDSISKKCNAHSSKSSKYITPFFNYLFSGNRKSPPAANNYFTNNFSCTSKLVSDHLSNEKDGRSNMELHMTNNSYHARHYLDNLTYAPLLVDNNRCHKLHANPMQEENRNKVCNENEKYKTCNTDKEKMQKYTDEINVALYAVKEFVSLLVMAAQEHLQNLEENNTKCSYNKHIKIKTNGNHVKSSESHGNVKKDMSSTITNSESISVKKFLQEKQSVSILPSHLAHSPKFIRSILEQAFCVIYCDAALLHPLQWNLYKYAYVHFSPYLKFRIETCLSVICNASAYSFHIALENLMRNTLIRISPSERLLLALELFNLWWYCNPDLIPFELPEHDRLQPETMRAEQTHNFVTSINILEGDKNLEEAANCKDDIEDSEDYVQSENKSQIIECNHSAVKSESKAQTIHTSSSSETLSLLPSPFIFVHNYNNNTTHIKPETVEYSLFSFCASLDNSQTMEPNNMSAQQLLQTINSAGGMLCPLLMFPSSFVETLTSRVRALSAPYLYISSPLILRIVEWSTRLLCYSAVTHEQTDTYKYNNTYHKVDSVDINSNNNDYNNNSIHNETRNVLQHNTVMHNRAKEMITQLTEWLGTINKTSSSDVRNGWHLIICAVIAIASIECSIPEIRKRANNEKNTNKAHNAAFNNVHSSRMSYRKTSKTDLSSLLSSSCKENVYERYQKITNMLECTLCLHEGCEDEHNHNVQIFTKEQTLCKTNSNLSASAEKIFNLVWNVFEENNLLLYTSSDYLQETGIKTLWRLLHKELTTSFPSVLCAQSAASTLWVLYSLERASHFSLQRLRGGNKMWTAQPNTFTFASKEMTLDCWNKLLAETYSCVEPHSEMSAEESSSTIKIQELTLEEKHNSNNDNNYITNNEEVKKADMNNIANVITNESITNNLNALCDEIENTQLNSVDINHSYISRRGRQERCDDVVEHEIENSAKYNAFCHPLIDLNGVRKSKYNVDEKIESKHTEHNTMVHKTQGQLHENVVESSSSLIMLRALQSNEKYVEYDGSERRRNTNKLLRRTKFDLCPLSVEERWRDVQSNLLQIFIDHANLPSRGAESGTEQDVVNLYEHTVCNNSCDNMNRSISNTHHNVSVYVLYKLMQNLSIYGNAFPRQINEHDTKILKNEVQACSTFIRCIEEDLLPDCHYSCRGLLHKMSAIYLTRSPFYALPELLKLHSPTVVAESKDNVTDIKNATELMKTHHLHTLSFRIKWERIVELLLWSTLPCYWHEWKFPEFTKSKPHLYRKSTMCNFGSGSLAWAVLGALMMSFEITHLLESQAVKANTLHLAEQISKSHTIAAELINVIVTSLQVNLPLPWQAKFYVLQSITKYILTLAQEVKKYDELQSFICLLPLMQSDKCAVEESKCESVETELLQEEQLEEAENEEEEEQEEEDEEEIKMEKLEQGEEREYKHDTNCFTPAEDEFDWSPEECTVNCDDGNESKGKLIEDVKIIEPEQTESALPAETQCFAEELSCTTNLQNFDQVEVHETNNYNHSK